MGRGIPKAHWDRWREARAKWKAARAAGDKVARPPCKMCLGPVPPPKRTFCGPDCVNRWLVLNNPQHARSLVKQRDKGVCAACGCDTDRLERTLRALWDRARPSARGDDRSAAVVAFRRLCVELAEAGYLPARVADMARERVPPFWPASHFWEADHKLPVADGGGGLNGDLDNLQTLCLACHKAKTRISRKP